MDHDYRTALILVTSEVYVSSFAGAILGGFALAARILLIDYNSRDMISFLSPFRACLWLLVMVFWAKVIRSCT